jgi:hypothetical protein
MLESPGALMTAKSAPEASLPLLKLALLPNGMATMLGLVKLAPPKAAVTSVKVAALAITSAATPLG